MAQGIEGLFSKAVYAYLLLWNGSVHLKFIPGQPHKGLFIVALAVPACPAVLYLREWGRSTIVAEFVMRILKETPAALKFNDGSFKALNLYGE
jgi:hypothetical protein